MTINRVVSMTVVVKRLGYSILLYNAVHDMFFWPHSDLKVKHRAKDDPTLSQSKLYHNLSTTHSGVPAVPDSLNPGIHWLTRQSTELMNPLSCSTLIHGASTSCISSVSRCIREASFRLRSLLVKYSMACSLLEPHACLEASSVNCVFTSVI